MLHALAAIAIATAQPAPQAAPVPRGPAIAPEFRLTGDVVSIPFVMVREFPFVEAEINGVKGKLMLDTGALEAMSLNHNPLKLPEGRSIGQGRFGSGQTYEMFLRPYIDSVRLAGGLSYGRVNTMRSQDARQLEGITPDFIGWIGYYFWDGYAVKMDYKASKATFYKGGPKAFLKGETVIAALPFETRKLPNHPIMTATVGGVAFETVFDTGQYGNIFTDAATLARLTKSGAVKPVAGEDNPADVTVRFAKGPPIALPKLATHPAEGAEPFAKAIGLKSTNIMSLGYAFLGQYKTVWDYPNKTLYLLKK